MKNKTVIITLILIFGAFLAVVLLRSGSNEEKEELVNIPDTRTDKVVADSAIPPVNREAEMPENIPGMYLDYDKSHIEKAADGKVVLFFKASWCPTCGALDKDIINNLDNIPEDVTILKVDYDSEIALKKQYGVTIQRD